MKKKTIFSAREHESDAFIPGNKQKWEFLHVPDRHLVKDQKTNSALFCCGTQDPIVNFHQ